ncbi:cation/H(+) antiporter 15-like [Coffea eugenioides]|uniref:Cation/H(+) antiporter 15-like n=1 Tax=Coffea arabica TaxID=13443 RepID=A0A6P6X032_COFAR|nr:cation/H(+) antiporter 15-like [Coffea arabica]XP_027165961.1 cation/H(+) antiporter 15-like [Coffea eugenioides]
MTNATITVDFDKLYQDVQCYSDTIYRFNGVWDGPNPLLPVVPLFLVQLTVAVLATRLLIIAFRPFNQPPFVAEILTGIILGPSVLGKLSFFSNFLFPPYYLPVLEPMAHYSLVYYALLTGLQMDIRAMYRTGTQAKHIAVAGIFIPMIIGSSSYFTIEDHVTAESPTKLGAFFWGSALTVTGFSVLSKVLDRQKILHTEIGKIAVASALLSDLASWFFLALGLAITGDKTTNLIWIVLSTCAVVLLCGFYVRPALSWIVKNTPEGQGYSEFYLCSVITGVGLLGVITDACGTHPLIGALVFGLIIPDEVLESVLVDRLKDVVNGIFMPVFFVACGLRADLNKVEASWIKVALIIILASSAKIVSALTISFLHDLPTKEAVAVGVLTNTKSTLALAILEIGLTQKALTQESFSVMVVAILVMTMVVTPATMLYRPTKNMTPYKRRTIQKAKSDEELRILACIYDVRNVPSIINLLEVSNSTQKSPITVFALHLVELIGRASAMLVVHSAGGSGPRNPSYLEERTEQILAAFENYKLQSEGVDTQVMTASSAYATMDEDICSIAKDKRAAFIMLPFHKQQTLDGDMEDINPTARNVNESVMENAPCSVGILIDRGLTDSQNRARSIAMLFFGGSDDREALAYAWRMAEHPETSLTVVRFISGQDTEEEEWDPLAFEDRDQVTIEIDSKSHGLLDDEFLNKFKIATVNDSSISFSELMLNDEEETVNAIKDMDGDNHDLYIVGKGRGVTSPLTVGLADWCDCPELGPIGDLLVTSEFKSVFSVLVVQQYHKPSVPRDGSVRSAGTISQRKDMEFRPSLSETETFEPYASFRKTNFLTMN